MSLLSVRNIKIYCNCFTLYRAKSWSSRCYIFNTCASSSRPVTLVPRDFQQIRNFRFIPIKLRCWMDVRIQFVLKLLLYPCSPQKWAQYKIYPSQIPHSAFQSRTILGNLLQKLFFLLHNYSLPESRTLILSFH